MLGRCLRAPGQGSVCTGLSVMQRDGGWWSSMRLREQRSELCTVGVDSVLVFCSMGFWERMPWEEEATAPFYCENKL